MYGFFRRRDRAEVLGIAFTAAFIFVLSAPPLAVSAWVSPEDIETGRVALSGPCPYKAAHGVPCTSCGLTRGFAAMSRGRLGDAVGFNALTPWLYFAFALGAVASGAVLVQCARRFAQLRRKRDQDDPRTNLATQS